MRAGKGLSLVEVLVTLTLLGILLSIALPDLATLVQSTRGEVRMKSLTSHIALARSTAVARKQRVTFCPSADQRQCGGRWAQGSLLFTDENGDRRLNAKDVVLRVSGPLPEGESLTWRAFQNRAYLQVEPSGFLRYQSGNFTWCPASGDARQARQLIVNATGRTRMALDGDGDGIAEDSRGEPLRCP